MSGHRLLFCPAKGPPRRALRCYSPAVSSGPVFASGRDAELVDLGGGRVLRRPLRQRPLDAEAVVMSHVRAAGYPVPEVFEVRPEGMVMERVDGPTMLDDLAAHPWRLRRHARTLAALHHDLHAIAPTDGMAAPFGAPAPDDVVVHADLHPANVLLSAGGPVVIDWSSGGRGPAGADVADAWLVLGSAQPPGGLLVRALAALLRGSFLVAFLRHAGRRQAVPYLHAAAERRAADPHLAGAEKAAMRRLAAVHGTGAPS
jgi:aminoglycoside phosphotransferase (APT) family kinase protein